MISGKTNGNVINLSQKNKFAKKGKKLNPQKIELLAIKKLGLREYRKELAKQFNVTRMTVSNAFAGEANYMLYSFYEFLKSIN